MRILRKSLSPARVFRNIFGCCPKYLAKTFNEGYGRQLAPPKSTNDPFTAIMRFFYFSEVELATLWFGLGPLTPMRLIFLFTVASVRWITPLSFILTGSNWEEKLFTTIRIAVRSRLISVVIFLIFPNDDPNC